MNRDLTFYSIEFGNAPKVFLAFADNNIPFKFVSNYSDVLDSILFESAISKDLIPEIIKICEDTNKTAILNLNNPNNIIAEISKLVLGKDVIITNSYSFESWKNFMLGVEEYTSTNSVSIEIDHPIDLENKILKDIINNGLELFEKRKEELDKIIKIGKKNKGK